MEILLMAGEVFGIAQTIVIPPDRAAEDPVSKSSLCVCPGSRKWTCTSMSPGRRTIFWDVRQSMCVLTGGLSVNSLRACTNNFAHLTSAMRGMAKSTANLLVLYPWVDTLLPPPDLMGRLITRSRSFFDKYSAMDWIWLFVVSSEPTSAKGHSIVVTGMSCSW